MSTITEPATSPPIQAADYRAFLKAKRITVAPSGFSVPAADINGKLFDWQRDVVRWALRRGRAALFEDCGLGKTPQQLEWASHVCRHSRRPVLLLTPCAVGPQTIREAAKFGIVTPAKRVASQEECIAGINVTNYERLHLFDRTQFGGIVLDESSILKSFTGATKRALIEFAREIPYRLACTATPAPNDLMELGNHAEFLGVMPSNEMLSVWFINDTMQCGKYRLRKHAARDFWQWVSSWSVCLSSPADLGHDASGYELPPLVVREHVLECGSPPPGFMFSTGSISATGVHQEKRRALPERADAVARLINGDADQWCVWCDTNYEADALAERIADAVEVRGSHSPEARERAFDAFATGAARVIISKPEIAGFGLNWQHCHKTTWFAGYSYERFYQAIRRMWRFGQQHPVEVHVVMTDAEQSIADTLRAKEAGHEHMKSEMADAMREFQIDRLYGNRELKTYQPTQAMEIPSWLTMKS